MKVYFAVTNVKFKISDLSSTNTITSKSDSNTHLGDLEISLDSLTTEMELESFEMIELVKRLPSEIKQMAILSKANNSVNKE